jgi:hypothetical protein
MKKHFLYILLFYLAFDFLRAFVPDLETWNLTI